jgi:anti-sigma-K factor RskA
VLHAGNVGAPAGLRITLEPAGASGGAPTGPVVLSGVVAP